MNFARSFKKRCIHVIYKFYPQKSKKSKKPNKTKQEQKTKTCDKSVNETMNFSFINKPNLFRGFISGDSAVKITS